MSRSFVFIVFDTGTRIFYRIVELQQLPPKWNYFFLMFTVSKCECVSTRSVELKVKSEIQKKGSDMHDISCWTIYGNDLNGDMHVM